MIKSNSLTKAGIRKTGWYMSGTIKPYGIYSETLMCGGISTSM